MPSRANLIQLQIGKIENKRHASNTAAEKLQTIIRRYNYYSCPTVSLLLRTFLEIHVYELGSHTGFVLAGCFDEQTTLRQPTRLLHELARPKRGCPPEITAVLGPRKKAADDKREGLVVGCNATAAGSS